jgi:hypothetical protein
MMAANQDPDGIAIPSATVDHLYSTLMTTVEGNAKNRFHYYTYPSTTWGTS